MFSDKVYVGIVGKSDCGTYLSNNITGWFPVDIVLKQSRFRVSVLWQLSLTFSFSFVQMDWFKYH